MLRPAQRFCPPYAYSAYACAFGGDAESGNSHHGRYAIAIRCHDGAPPAQSDGSLHDWHGATGGVLRCHRRRRYLHLGAAAIFLQRANSRQLRLRAAASRHPDFLGHRRNLVSGHAHYGRPGLCECRAEAAALHRRIRNARSVLRRLGSDLDFVRQGAEHTRRQCSDLRSAIANLAIFSGRVAGGRVRSAADCRANLPVDLPAGTDGRPVSDQAGRVSMAMDTDAVAILGFSVLFALILLRVPVGMAKGLGGVAGFPYLSTGTAAFKIVGHTSMRTVTDYTFGVIPMFLLMGAFVTNSGMSRELFRAANGFLGHRRGGLGVATIAACGGFAALSGSPVAPAPAASTVAYPEMRRYGYPQSFAAGVIAAGGTLGAMLPPSTVLAVYGIITEQDIGKLFIAGIVPGILAASMYMITVAVIVWARPKYLPAGPRTQWRERLKGLRDIWATLLLFCFVIGGLYGGLFTPTEAGGMGPGGAVLIGLLRGRLNRLDIRRSLLQATRTAAAAVTGPIGALL